MTTEGEDEDRPTTRRKHGTALAAGVLALAMLGMAYAAVPIYRLVCQVTGLNGTTQRAEQGAGKVIDRTIIVRFDSTLAQGMPWVFEPVQRQVTVRLGETAMAFFRATNTSDHVVTGTATFNVTPEIAGRYFNKIQCFCFEEQTLKPGESVEMPVVFFVDPALTEEVGARDIGSITLSYTFFEVPETAAPKDAKAPASG